MTPLELTQMKASCGINKLAAEHIEYLQKTIKVSAQCMKEMQDRIDRRRRDDAEYLMDAYLNGVADGRCESVDSLPNDASLAAHRFVKEFMSNETFR